MWREGLARESQLGSKGRIRYSVRLRFCFRVRVRSLASMGREDSEERGSEGRAIAAGPASCQRGG